MQSKDKTVKEIVREHIGQEVQEINQVMGKGQVNEVYIVTLDNSKYVVRIDPNESSAARFQKEAWCMGEAEKLGILVPKTLAVGVRDDLPYMLLSYIDGIHGEAAGQNIQIQIWTKLGEYARKIHTIKVSGFGDRMTVAGTFDASWDKYLNYNISSLNTVDDKLFTSGLITSEQSNKLKATFLKLKETNFNFGLNHHDLSLKNSIVAPSRDVYLLDWGSAEVNVVPHMDIGEVLYSSLKEDSAGFEIFLKSYGMTREEFEKIKPDIFRLRLLTYTDKVRWALDRKPELVEEKVKNLKKILT